jgi:hypothetical protein
MILRILTYKEIIRLRIRFEKQGLVTFATNFRWDTRGSFSSFAIFLFLLLLLEELWLFAWVLSALYE